MSEEVTIAMAIAQGVAVWHLVVALYLVAYAEVKTPFLMSVAVIKAALGSLIYLIVLEPEWAFLGAVDGLLLPMALILLGVISILLTWTLWQLYEIRGPATAVIAAVSGGASRLWGLLRG